MTFLKKLGQILSIGLQILGVSGPLLQNLFGSSQAGRVASVAINDFTAIGTTVIQIETALQGKTGTDKLAAAVPLVTNIIKTSEMVSGHQIKNEAEFTASCTDITNGVVRLLNSLSADNLHVSGTSNPIPPAQPAPPAPAVPAVAKVA